MVSSDDADQRTPQAGVLRSTDGSCSATTPVELRRPTLLPFSLLWTPLWTAFHPCARSHAIPISPRTALPPPLDGFLCSLSYVCT